MVPLPSPLIRIVVDELKQAALTRLAQSATER
jgi:hypothetical protein